jgi:ABC-type oligopeptide transport system substrate-binding subunit
MSALLGLVFLLSGVAEAGKNRPLVWAETAQPTTMDPLRPASAVDRRVHALVYDRLFTRTDTGWESRVLTDVSITSDGRLSASTAPNIRWHDGQRLMPRDICHSIDTLNQTPQSPYYRNASSRPVRCEIDEGTTRVWVHFIERPLAEPRASLAIPLVQAPRSSATRAPRVPVGTGPMRARYAGHWIFEAWSGAAVPPDIAEMHLAVQPSRAAQVQALLDGQLDGVIAVPPALLPKVRAANLDLRFFDQKTWWYVTLNSEKAPLDDPALRSALNASLDREALRKQLITLDPDRDSQPSHLITGPSSRDSPRYNRGVQSPAYRTAEPRPLDLRLAVPETLDLPAREVLDALTTQWAAFGVTGSVVPPHADLSSFHMVVGTWSDEDDLSALYHSPTPSRGLSNPFGIGDPHVDRLLRDMDNAETPLERDQLSRELHALLADSHTHLYLWELDWWSAWRPGIEHQVITPRDYFGQLSDWKRP